MSKVTTFTLDGAIVGRMVESGARFRRISISGTWQTPGTLEVQAGDGSGLFGVHTWLAVLLDQDPFNARYALDVDYLLTPPKGATVTDFRSFGQGSSGTWLIHWAKGTSSTEVEIQKESLLVIRAKVRTPQERGLFRGSEFNLPSQLTFDYRLSNFNMPIEIEAPPS